MIDINPQQVLIVAEQLIQGGWIQGAEHNAEGVCIVGALRDAVGQVLRPQVEALCAEIPEYVGLDHTKQRAFVTELVRRYDNPLINVFRTRFAQVFGHEPIESWNDMGDRQKTEVLDAMRATLEIVTQECLEAWKDEAPVNTPDGVYVAKG